MQFKVPQFLDIEDKIFGPFTFKEFVYLAGGAGLSFVFYKALGFYWGALPIFAVAGLSLSLTFYKPNNKPFINMLEAGMKYALQNKLYIWKRKQNKTNNIQNPVVVKSINTYERGSKLDGSKLRDLAWSLDVLDLSKQSQKFSE